MMSLGRVSMVRNRVFLTSGSGGSLIVGIQKRDSKKLLVLFTGTGVSDGSLDGDQKSRKNC
jgi:hypothetical protein